MIRCYKEMYGCFRCALTSIKIKKLNNAYVYIYHGIFAVVPSADSYTYTKHLKVVGSYCEFNTVLLKQAPHTLHFKVRNINHPFLIRTFENCKTYKLIVDQILIKL